MSMMFSQTLSNSFADPRLVTPSLYDPGYQMWIILHFSTTALLPHLFLPSKTAALVPELAWKTCLRQNFILSSCACNEGPALRQNTLMMTQNYESFISGGKTYKNELHFVIHKN